MIVAKNVPDLVGQHGEQVHAVLLALIAGRGELGIVPRRQIDEPAPAGGVVVERDDVDGGEESRGLISDLVLLGTMSL